MCVFNTPKSAAAPMIANPGGREASAEADREARLRRRRSAAGAVLTSPRGIPASTSQLGAPA